MPTVYETMRVANGVVPFLDRHMRRFAANSRRAGLPDAGDVRGAIADAIAGDASGSADRALRLFWDGDVVSVKLLDMPGRAPMKVITASVRHGGYEVKTTDREVFDRAREEAVSRGADEALLLTADGWIAEGTLFAVGWFEGAILRVPSLDLGILPSIGRERVLEIAQQLAFPVEEGRFPRSALDGRPAFAVTATRGLIRIAQLDGAPVPDDPRIARLRDAFWPE